ncbi:SIMPL domain-containing protein [Candidatus Microgenomates bacterium]|nr:SIMPL domain-containing protein [Candidatus Microgenomates bacterium]
MKENKISLPVFGLFIGVSLIVSTYLLATILKDAIPSNQVVKVRGVANEILELKHASWDINIKVLEDELEKAYFKASKATEEVLKYLQDSGISKDVIEVSGFSQRRVTRTVYEGKNNNRREIFMGHEVKRKIIMAKTSDLDLLGRIYKKFSGDLQRRKVPASPQAPYFFSDIDTAKLKKRLLEKASKNAFMRAKIIAENSESQIGALRAARQGDFTGISYNGKIGSSSRLHRVTSLVTIDYSLK